MGNTIVINDGVKTYEIKNQKGELLGEFSFNPSDSNLIERYTEGVKRLQEKEKELVNNSAKTAEEIIAEDDFVKETIDEIFNANISEQFFSIMGVRSVINGKFYFEFVLETMGRIIKEESRKQRKAMQKRIDKYAKRYQ